MKTVKRAVFMMFVLSLALLTACGGKQETSPSGGGSTTTPKTKSDAQNGSAAQVKIEYFQMKNEVVDVVNRLIEKFESEHPGIDVEQNNVPNPENVWSIRLSTNDAPDVFTHYPHNAVFRELVREGRVVDLTQDPLLANINPAIVDLSQIDGKNYLVPIALATMGVYYNVDLFHELHLDIPQTYDELIQTAEKLKAAGYTPFYFHDKDWNGIRQEVVFKMGMELDNISEFLDDVMNGNKHITEHPQIRALAERILQLREYGQQDSLGTGYEDALRGFANGKGAMWFTGIWAIPSIQDANPNLNFSMFPFPALNAEDTKLQVTVDTAIGLPAGGKNEEAARTFVEFMAAPENVQVYVDAGKYPAAVQGVQNNVPEMAKLSELIDAGKVYPTIMSVWPPGVAEEVGKATQEMFAAGDIDSYLQNLDTIFYNRYNQ